MNVERLNELTNSLIKVCPALIAPAPNKLLTFQELREIGEKDPDRRLIKEDIYSGCYYTTAKDANKTLEVFVGGCTSYYHDKFLVEWRVWETDPLTSITIETPWLEYEQVKEYTSYFILNPDVKKFYKKYNEYPSVQSKGFKDYKIG